MKNENNKQEPDAPASELGDLLCALDSVRSAIACSARDWRLNNRDAWVYGIVVGWDNASLTELQKKFRWDNTTVSLLKKHHSAYKIGAQR